MTLKFFYVNKELKNYLLDKFFSRIPKDLPRESFLEYAEELKSRIDQNFEQILKEEQSRSDEAFINIVNAHNSDDKKERIQLAKKALKLDENCIDAYLILATDECT